MIKEYPSYYEEYFKINYPIYNVNLDDKKDLLNIGKFITETKYDHNIYISESFQNSNGIFLYQNNNNPLQAYRLYKDLFEYPYIYHDDHILITKLQERQPNIKLTSFPLGIITMKNKVIGQVIPFYEHYQTLYNKISYEDIYINYYYEKIIDILEELLDNNIIYQDIHYRNFLIKDDIVKLIDFESKYITFSYDNQKYQIMLNNLCNMINKVNKCLNIELDLSNINNLTEIKKKILK